MKYEWVIAILSRMSLLDMARFVLHKFVPFVVVVIVLFALFGCNTMEVVPRHERLPKIQINSEYADDIEVKIKDDSIIFKFEWEL